MKHIETGFDCWCNPKIHLVDGNTVTVHHDVLLVRKKPVEVTAKLWDGTKRCFDDLLDWESDDVFYLLRPSPPYVKTKTAPDFFDLSLYIKTFEGDMRANIGDYIIRGISGEFYPIKSEIFHKTYDIVEGE